MKKKMVVLAAAFLFACTAPTNVQWFQGSFEQAVQTAQQQNKPILLDFYSDT